MKITCESCAHEMNVSARVVVPDSQRFVVSIAKKPGHEAEMWAAKTIGGLIVDTRKLLIAVAKDVGETVDVFVSGLTMGDGRVEIEFVVLRAG